MLLYISHHLCQLSVKERTATHITIQAPATAPAMPGCDSALVVAAAGSAQAFCQRPVRAPRPQSLPLGDDAPSEPCTHAAVHHEESGSSTA